MTWTSNPQSPEEVAAGLRQAFQMAIEDGTVSPPPVSEESSANEPLPLWRVMETAYLDGRRPGFADNMGYAAEIEALRDWLLPEEPEPRGSDCHNLIRWGQWYRCQDLRALLTEQARIAREGK